MLPDSPSDPVERFLETKRGPICYSDEGSGAVILALHGAPGSCRDWRWIGAVLEKDMRLIRLDLPGFGGTPLKTFPDPSFEGRADWIAEFLEQLGITSCVALGHSAGGPLAMALASRHPERVRGLALISSVGLRPHRPFRRYPRMRRVSPFLRVPVLREVLTLILRQGFKAAGFPLGLSGETIRQCMHVVGKVEFESFAELLATLDLPALVAWADDDPLIDASISQELAESCPEGPRLHYADGGHNIQKSKAVEIAESLIPWAGRVCEA